MFNEIILIVSIYYFINISEYILHKLSHNYKYGGVIYNWHKKHHTIEFPLKNLTRNEYPKIIPRYQNIFIYFILIWWILMYSILERYYFNILFIESSIYFVVIDKLHESYHLNNSIFEKYEWFRKKKRIHLLHHIKHNKNFNLVDLTGDKINITYIIK